MTNTTTGNAGESGRVLLVDKSEFALFMVSSGLRSAGWEVYEASKGKRALRMLPEIKPEAIVVDLRMPKMDGFQLLSYIQRIDPDLPVIIHSAADDLQLVLKAVRRGAFDFVLKSESGLDSLATALGRAVTHYRMLKENKRLTAELRQANTELAKRNEDLGTRRDQVEATSQAKSALLANMSYELRRPLDSILGYIDLLSAGLDPEGQAAADAEAVRDAAVHQLTLVEGLYLLSRLEAGDYDFCLERTRVKNLCEEVVELVTPIAERMGNHIDVQVDPDVDEMVTDVQTARKCLRTLLRNANLHTRNGEVTLRVSRVQHTDTDSLRFQVRDTGLGMTQAQCERLFEEFARGRNAGAEDLVGFWLALPLVRRLCRLPGGDVTVESHPGLGTTFTMLLPLHTGDEEVKGTPVPERQRTSLPSSTEPTGVLLVQSSSALREAIAGALGTIDCDVQTSSNFARALRYAQERPPSVVVLGVEAPNLDGWTALRSFKAIPTLRHLPVVLVATDPERGRGLAFPFRGYVQKPFLRADLTAVTTPLAPDDDERFALVVDDDAICRDLAARMLEIDGWTVEQAKDAEQAIVRIERFPPDLMLIEPMLSDGTGFRLLAALRANRLWTSIPVVMMLETEIPPVHRNQLGGDLQRVLRILGKDRTALALEIRNHVRVLSRSRR